MPYTCKRGTDSTDDTIYILNPHGGEMAVIQFWADEPDDERDAEAVATLIVDALNGQEAMLNALRLIGTA
jgi:creatinine amidohydrolase/Fe(II)-dependent formamide hydrolase-like protein